MTNKNKQQVEEIVEKHLKDCVFCHKDISPFVDHIRVHNLVEELTKALHQAKEEERRIILDEMVQKSLEKEHKTSTKDEYHSGRFWSLKDLQQELIKSLTPKDKE